MQNSLIVQKRRVLLNDLDINLHMNNGRYMTILDLGIVESLIRSGFINVVRALNAHIVLGGSLITYRRPLNPLEKYDLQMKYLGSTPAWHIFEFAYVNSKKQICAKGVLKGGVVKKGQGIVPSQTIWAKFEELGLGEVSPPPLPDYVTKWLDAESNQSLQELV